MICRSAFELPVYKYISTRLLLLCPSVTCGDTLKPSGHVAFSAKPRRFEVHQPIPRLSLKTFGGRLLKEHDDQGPHPQSPR